MLFGIMHQYYFWDMEELETNEGSRRSMQSRLYFVTDIAWGYFFRHFTYTCEKPIVLWPEANFWWPSSLQSHSRNVGRCQDGQNKDISSSRAINYQRYCTSSGFTPVQYLINRCYGQNLSYTWGEAEPLVEYISLKIGLLHRSNKRACVGTAEHMRQELMRMLSIRIS